MSLDCLPDQERLGRNTGIVASCNSSSRWGCLWFRRVPTSRSLSNVVWTTHIPRRVCPRSVCVRPCSGRGVRVVAAAAFHPTQATSTVVFIFEKCLIEKHISIINSVVLCCVSSMNWKKNATLQAKGPSQPLSSWGVYSVENNYFLKKWKKDIFKVYVNNYWFEKKWKFELKKFENNMLLLEIES